MSQDSYMLNVCDKCADKGCCEVSDMLKCEQWLRAASKVVRGLL